MSSSNAINNLARIEWIDGSGSIASLKTGVDYEIGRSTSCAIRLDMPSVSGHHARLSHENGHWLLTDQKSTNGTSVNGDPIEQRRLVSGDEISIGDILIRFIETKKVEESKTEVVPASPADRPSPSLIFSGISSFTDRYPGWQVAAVSFVLGIFCALLVFFVIHGSKAPENTPEHDIKASIKEEYAAAPLAFPPSAHLDRLPRESFETMLNTSSEQRRIIRLDKNPYVLVIDFPSLAAQGRMMNRLAALIEKEGLPKDRVVSEAELAEYIKNKGGSEATFYYGHNYRSSALALFFQLASESTDGWLRDDERVLRDTLLELGVIHRHEGRYIGADTPIAVVTIVQEEAQAQGARINRSARKTILRHELSHGEYFTNPVYRGYVLDFWHNEMSEEERDVFRDFLAKSNYNPADDDLMANETQAYLMHTPDPRAFNAAMIGISEGQLNDLRTRFASNAPETWLDLVFEPIKN